MADFSIAYPLTIRLEGGHVLTDYPTDAGGETYAGISRRYHPGWKGWVIIDAAKSRASGFTASDVTRLENLTMEFYREEFWNPLYLDHVNHQELANLLFDMAVNHGHGTAVELLQECLNAVNYDPETGARRWEPDLSVDGDFGPKTLARIACVLAVGSASFLLITIQKVRGGYYTRLASRRMLDRANLKGWYNRNDHA